MPALKNQRVTWYEDELQNLIVQPKDKTMQGEIIQAEDEAWKTDLPKVNLLNNTKRKIKRWKKQNQDAYQFAYQNYKNLCRLERLSEDWESHLAEMETILYANGAEKYQEIHKEEI